MEFTSILFLGSITTVSIMFVMILISKIVVVLKTKSLIDMMIKVAVLALFTALTITAFFGVGLVVSWILGLFWVNP